MCIKVRGPKLHVQGVHVHVLKYACCIHLILQDSGGKKGFRSSLWQENKKREKQIQV